MKSLRILLIALVGFTANSAMSQNVRLNFSKSTDFDKFRTYKWVPIPEAALAEGPTDQQIRSAFDAELAKKHLEKVDGETADLFVGYQFGIKAQQELGSIDKELKYQVGLPTGGTTTFEENSTVHEGELALDMYATSSRTRVWRGVASKTIDLEAKPDARQKHLAKAVKKLIEYYPPTATGGR